MNVKKQRNLSDGFAVFVFAVKDLSHHFEECDFLYSAGLIPTYFLNFL